MSNSSSTGSNLSFASDVKSPHIGELDGGAEWPGTLDVFWQLLQHWVTQGLERKVHPASTPARQQ